MASGPSTSHDNLGPPRRRPGLIARQVDAIQRQGRYGFSVGELGRGSSAVAVRAAVRRLIAAGRLRRLTPHGDFLVIVPPEYASLGAPPASWFIDDYMRHRGIQYYVALLSAAEWYGSAHFAVQEIQIMTSAQLRPIDIGRERLRFFVKKGIERSPVRELSAGKAAVRVGTPEATLLDLLRYRDASGGLGRVTTIIGDLGRQSRTAELRRALDAADDVVTAQRLGFVLEHGRQAQLARTVARWLEGRPRRFCPLDPAGPAEGERHPRWKLVVNVSLERHAA